MSIKPLAAFTLALALTSQNFLLRAQSPSPGAMPAPAPVPSATPAAATPTPAEKPKEQKAPAKKSPTPTTRAVIDGLSQADLDDAVKQLKANYINPASLSDEELNKATLQGLIERLSPGASIFAQPPEPPAPSPFRAEILNGQTGYLRMGSIARGNIDEMDSALQNFNSKDLKAIVIDLRATPASSDFDMAAEVLKRFCPKGKLLFTVKKTSEKQERMATSNMDPVFHGLVVVLADKETSGAAEVIAAALRIDANAMIVGSNTAGQPLEFSDIPLPGGKILRVAVAEVMLPGNVTIFPKGLQPDIVVDMPQEVRDQIMQESLDKGVSQFVFETERAHMNEAALVAKTNPEIDALEAAQKARLNGGIHAPLRDTVLQHALDLITSIDIYQGKPPEKAASSPAQ
jgi:C-terminal processing protease CtpA/Prc